MMRYVTKYVTIRIMDATHNTKTAGIVKPRDLPDWLIARGTYVFSTEEASHLMDIPTDHVRQRLVPLRRRGAVVSAGRGLWLAVPADRRAWGAPEPMGYIDDLMRAMGVDYAVGWLSAAALRGASHQAAQVFQVAVERQVRSRDLGRSRLEFSRRSYLDELPKERLTLASGRAEVARTEAIMLMLAADLDLAGGIDNAATTMLELAQENGGWEDGIAAASRLFPATAGRRCGWIIEHFLQEGSIPCSRLDVLADVCASRGGSSVLDPHLPRAGMVDSRWGINVNRELEPDA